MAGKAYKEPIDILTLGTVGDGQLGSVGTGTNTKLYDAKMVSISEVPANPLFVDVQQFQYSQSITFLNDPSKVITEANVVEWRNKRLTIKSVKYNDTRRTVMLNTVSQ